MTTKKKPRVVYTLEETTGMICNDKNKLVFGVCWHKYSEAKDIQSWAGGKIVKFKEVK